MRSILWRILYLFLFLLSLLPLNFLYLLLKPIYWLLFYIIKYRRNVVKQNLTNSFPEKSIHEIETLEKKYYQYLVKLIAETIKCISISKKEVIRRVKLKNPELFKELYIKHNALIVLLGHVGNWELIALSSVFMTKHDFYIVYKHIKNPFFNQKMKEIRERFGAKLISMEETYVNLKDLQNEKAVFTLVSDQNPSNIKNAKWVTFLNQETVFLSGPEILYKKLQLPILYLDIYCTNSGYYDIELKVLVDEFRRDQDVSITQIYASALEQTIKRQPELWLWSHKRWKHKLAKP
jgi:KDO2-lipid IV(A) lauroyltransferase